MKFSDLLHTPAEFLMLGKCDAELKALCDAKWSGVCVAPPMTWGKNPLSDDEYYSQITYIEGQLSIDGHITRMMEGYWIKPLSVRELFDQFGSSKYRIIIINVPMMSRQLWESEQIQVHMPKYHLIPEDGHNEGIVKRAAELGYATKQIEGEWLLMAR